MRAGLLPAAAAGAAILAWAGSSLAEPLRWVGSWASAQQIPEPQNALATADLANATLRQVVHLSVGGAQVRVRVSNAFGTAPLHLAAVRVARAASPTSPAIQGAHRAVSFGGASDVTIPAGAEYWSDPVDLAVPALSDLSISIHFDVAPTQQTGHPGSRQVSWLAKGDQTAAADFAGALAVEQWRQVSGVDVAGARASSAVVTFGDSITDGYGVKPGANTRWPDVLARRLQAGGARTRAVGVLNAGIGGNHVLTDGLGPNLVSRFDRDVLAQSGVRAVILLEAVNDLGALTRDAPATSEAHDALVRRILLAYQQMIARGRARGVKMIGGTVTPFAGSDYYHPGASNEADRQRINAWIRTPGHFDAVIDFDKSLRDPARPDRLKPEYDSGDHLHPSASGYRAMAEAVPLNVLVP